MALNEPEYPVQFSVDFLGSPLNRLTTFFRPLVIIPIVIIVDLINGGSAPGAMVGIGSGTVVLALMLMIPFRQKYPRWWFDWNLALLRFENRVMVFFLLMGDQYPSTDEEQSVHLEIPYPDVKTDLNRWLPLVKWILAIPHYIVWSFLLIGVIVAVVVSWFAILLTGRFPRNLFNFVEGWLRYTNRVIGYSFVLANDRYPPFRLVP